MDCLFNPILGYGISTAFGGRVCQDAWYSSICTGGFTGWKWFVLIESSLCMILLRIRFAQGEDSKLS